MKTWKLVWCFELIREFYFKCVLDCSYTYTNAFQICILYFYFDPNLNLDKNYILTCNPTITQF